MKKLNIKLRRKINMIASFIFMFFMFQTNIMAQCTPESLNTDESEIIRLELGETLNINGLVIRYIEGEISDNSFIFSHESIKIADNETQSFPKMDFANFKTANNITGKQDKM
jgi:hypothetical protein